MRVRLAHRRTEARERVIRQRRTQSAGQRAQDGPVFPGLARRKDRAVGVLRPSLGIDVGGVFLGISRARQDHVGCVRAMIAVMALVDDEGVLQLGGRDFIGSQQEHHFDFAARSAVNNPGRIPPALARDESHVQSADPARRGVQHAEPGRAACILVCYGPRRCQHRSAIGTSQSTLPDHDHRPFGILQDLGEIIAAIGHGLQALRPRSQIRIAVGQVGILTDHADFKAVFQPRLADPRVPDRRFDPWVGADQQQCIGLFHASQAGVQNVSGAAGRIDGRTILATIHR